MCAWGIDEGARPTCSRVFGDMLLQNLGNPKNQDISQTLLELLGLEVTGKARVADPVGIEFSHGSVSGGSLC